MRNRSRLEIDVDILKAARRGGRLSHIANKTNLNSIFAKTRLNSLVEKGFLRPVKIRKKGCRLVDVIDSRRLYVTTESGGLFVEEFLRINNWYNNSQKVFSLGPITGLIKEAEIK